MRQASGPLSPDVHAECFEEPVISASLSRIKCFLLQMTTAEI